MCGKIALTLETPVIALTPTCEQDDSEYPDWLWTLQEPRQTRQELMRKAQGLFDAGGYDAVFDGMSEAELKRLFRLDARARIKEENNRRRGGRIV